MKKIHIVIAQFANYNDKDNPLDDLNALPVIAFDTKEKADKRVDHYKEIRKLLIKKYEETDKLVKEWASSYPTPKPDYWEYKQECADYRLKIEEEEGGYRRLYVEQLGFDIGNDRNPRYMTFYVYYEVTVM